MLAQNAGESDDTSDISVLFYARLQGVSWGCTVTPPGSCLPGSGDIATQVALPIGSQVQFDITAAAPGEASNTPLSVTAAVTPVADTDVDRGNNRDSIELQTALFLDGFEGANP